MKPSREAMIAALYAPTHAPMSTHHGGTGECLQCPWPVHELGPEEIADAVLALLPGKTEQEVREEVAREHEEKMDRLLEGEWQAGYVAGNNDQLNGTICGRRRAANESIARGGEGG